MKAKLDEMNRVDFEAISNVLRQSVERREIDTDDIGYIAASMLSLAVKTLKLTGSETGVLDQALGVIMVAAGRDENE